jgi:hypothetical protein
MTEYILADIERKIGSKNHSWIYDITFVNPETLEVCMCVVDESYRNYSKWQHLVTGTIPYGIYTGLRRINRKDKDGVQVINADHAPQLIAPMTEQEVELVLETRREQLGWS